MLDIAKFDAICRSLPGIKQQSPSRPGIRGWTVDGRVYAMMAEGSDRISLRCADEKVAQLLVDHGRAGMLPDLPHGAWEAELLTL